MYLEFFGFSKKPFENTTEREFFFESQSHIEAYSRISYVVEDKKPLAMLTGAYGTGKTFVLKAIENDYSKKNYLFSFVSNPSVDEVGIIKLVVHNFISYKLPESKTDLLILLEKFLKDTHRDGKHCIVVIDEAQNIAYESVFEEIRMLLNYQINSKPLLTLIISGQSELSEKIASNKQLIQRVFLTYDIKPLNEEETRDYVIHRLKIAGRDDVFEDESFPVLYQLSGGIPRWINNISSMALLTAFSKKIRTINSEIISEAYSSIKGEV
jgi:type II secretory pathway predicted ATPase ExeA